MNETTKKVALVTIIVLAVVFVAFQGLRFFQGDQPQVVRRIEGDPAHSMKRMEMEAQTRGTSSSTPTTSGERDLGESLAGGSAVPKSDR